MGVVVRKRLYEGTVEYAPSVLTIRTQLELDGGAACNLDSFAKS